MGVPRTSRWSARSTALVLAVALCVAAILPARAGGIQGSDRAGALPARPGPISGTVPYGWPYTLPWWCSLPTSALPPPAAGMPTVIPPTPLPSPTPGGRATSATYSVCRRIQGRVPRAVLDAALLEPWTVHGFGLCRNPNVPYHPLWNPLRAQLHLLNPNVPWGICNPVVWKAGCL